MKKPIEIEDFFFSDGIVEEYEFDNNELKMLFNDSCDSKLAFYFRDDIQVKERGSVGLSVYESRLKKNGDKTTLYLLDDDLKEMLIIQFRTYQIEEAN